MDYLKLSRPDRVLRADIRLDSSKSLSNRALICLALTGEQPEAWLSNLSNARDTVRLRALLNAGSPAYDAGDAGTTFRFLTAFLALQPGAQVLTGSERMRARPIGALVDALRRLGADIDYLEREGYPPLRIGDWRPAGPTACLAVRADVSSQFLSALLLIAPYLPAGLEIEPQGPLVSRPYLDMTLGVMRHFGAEAGWQGARLVVAPGRYTPRPLMIEADWSAASYWYAMAALSERAELRLHGLSANSLQGDAAVAGLFERFGVSSHYEAGEVVRITREPCSIDRQAWSADFNRTPDLAQTLTVVCAGLGVPATLTGLETLAIKETDRVDALRRELARVGVTVQVAPDRAALRLVQQAQWTLPPRFATYDDHRMALAFAPLALLAPIEIEHPAVVQKSYPAFWTHLEEAGFELEKKA